MDYEESRREMVASQLVRRGIKDPKVLEAFGKVPRHRFVPSPLASSAYNDYPLPIGYGQTISQPYIVALMTECLHLKGSEKVLEIGTGSGYQAAILAEICRQVYTIEKDAHLSEQAKKILFEERYQNINFQCGDGTKGIIEHAPFDGIVVTAAAPQIPETLKAQLSDGAYMVIPVGTMYSQMLVSIRRKGNEFFQQEICGCVFVPLIGEHGFHQYRF